MSDSETRAILFDVTRCGGCYECVGACMKSHGFGGDPEKVTELSANAYTALVPLKDDFMARVMCRHCVEPSCASVCPVKALHKSEFGSVIYEAEKCMGCRYCMLACPFGVPRYEWDKTVPAVRKCDMCIDRLREGKIPACAEACEQEATVAGTRAELLEEAHRRIAEAPDEYYDHVYGEHEIGGTSVLYLTPFPVEELGFDKSLGKEPLPDLTWAAMKLVPKIGVSVGATLLAFWWITSRRDEVAQAEALEARRRGRRNGSNGEG